MSELRDPRTNPRPGDVLEWVEQGERIRCMVTRVGYGVHCMVWPGASSLSSSIEDWAASFGENAPRKRVVCLPMEGSLEGIAAFISHMSARVEELGGEA